MWPKTMSIYITDYFHLRMSCHPTNLSLLHSYHDGSSSRRPPASNPFPLTSRTCGTSIHQLDPLNTAMPLVDPVIYRFGSCVHGRSIGGFRPRFSETRGSRPFLLVSCHVSTLVGANVDAIIRLAEFGSALRTALQLPNRSEGRDIDRMGMTAVKGRNAHRGLHRLWNAGFTLIQTLVESAEAGGARQQWYRVSKGKFVAGTGQEQRYGCGELRIR